VDREKVETSNIKCDKGTRGEKQRLKASKKGKPEKMGDMK
jgi:hypothetical protein